MDDETLVEIDRVAHSMGISRSEAVRRMIHTIKALYNPNLRFSDALRPIPELLQTLGKM